MLERSFFPVTFGALLGYLPERGAGRSPWQQPGTWRSLLVWSEASSRTAVSQAPPSAEGALSVDEKGEQ